MINTKKKINKIKTENFLKEFPIIFLLQHNNFTVNDWLDFRKKMQEINEKSFKNSCKEFLNKSIDSSFLNLSNDLKFDKFRKSNIEILTIKNTLLKKILETKTENLNSIDFICQGPNFIVGCKNEKNLHLIWNSINSNSKLLFISCFYKNQLLTHLDFEILLKTDNSVYQNLFINLDKKHGLYSTLQNTLTLCPLVETQSNLINVLSFFTVSILNQKT